MVNSHNVSYVIMLFIYKMVYNFFSALLLTHLSLVLYRIGLLTAKLTITR